MMKVDCIFSEEREQITSLNTGEVMFSFCMQVYGLCLCSSESWFNKL